MYKYFLVTFFLLCIAGFGKANAQDLSVVRDSTVKRRVYKPRLVRDSAFLVRQKFVTDSIMTHTWILPDSLINKHMLMDSIMKANVFEKLDLDAWFKKYSKLKKVSRFRTGTPLHKGQTWVLGFIVLLLVVFAVLRISFSKQLQSIVQSFYSNRGLNNLNKEDNVFSSWPFLFLFIQFGFTIGMFFLPRCTVLSARLCASGISFFLSVFLFLLWCFMR